MATARPVAQVRQAAALVVGVVREPAQGAGVEPALVVGVAAAEQAACRLVSRILGILPK